MSSGGWIKSYRCIKDSTEIIADAAVCQLWVWILHSAAFKDKDVRFNGKTVHLDGGSMVTSERILMEELEQTRHHIRRALNVLRDRDSITTSGNHRSTTINVLNWATYQGDSDENQPLIYHSSTTDLPLINHSSTTDVCNQVNTLDNQTPKKEKNEKKEKKLGEHTSDEPSSTPVSKVKKPMTPKEIELEAEVTEVITYWIATCAKKGKRVKDTSKRRTKIRARLKVDKMTVETLKKACDGILVDPWGERWTKSWNHDAELMFKSETQVQKYIDLLGGSPGGGSTNNDELEAAYAEACKRLLRQGRQNYGPIDWTDKRIGEALKAMRNGKMDILNSTEYTEPAVKREFFAMFRRATK